MSVSLDQFLYIRGTLAGKSIPSLVEKSKHLKSSCTCFASGGNQTPSYHTSTSSFTHNLSHRHVSGHSRPGPARTDIIKIGCRDLSRENLARKDFLALMNKLTDTNRETIFRGLKNVYRSGCTSIYVQIIWDMMQRSPNFITMYISVIDILATCDEKEAWKQQWTCVWDTFIGENAWDPRKHCPNDNDAYDEFCDAVKWKKRVLAGVVALACLSEKDWISEKVGDILVEKVLAQIDVQADPRMTEIMLDEIKALLPHLSYEATLVVAKWCNSVDNSAVRPASRFKLLDLSDIIDKKMTNSFRPSQQSQLPATNQQPRPVAHKTEEEDSWNIQKRSRDPWKSISSQNYNKNHHRNSRRTHLNSKPRESPKSER